MSRAIDSARNQHELLFRRMAQGGRWHLHRGSAGYVLLQEGAQVDGDPLPVVLRNVQTMGSDTMCSKLAALENKP